MGIGAELFVGNLRAHLVTKRRFQDWPTPLELFHLAMKTFRYSLSTLVTFTLLVGFFLYMNICIKDRVYMFAPPANIGDPVVYQPMRTSVIGWPFFIIYRETKLPLITSGSEASRIKLEGYKIGTETLEVMSTRLWYEREMKSFEFVANIFALVFDSVLCLSLSAVISIFSEKYVGSKRQSSG